MASVSRVTDVCFAGSTRRITGTFTSPAGALTNPTSLVVTVTSPAGTVTNPTATSSSTGVYYVDVECTSSGSWTVTFDGTGAVDVSAECKITAIATATVT
jgi:hypothetical protein